MRKKLSPKLIDSLPAATTKRYEVRDDLVVGLMIRVSVTGAKVWYLATPVKDRARRIKLGTYPVLSLADARDKAREVLRQIQLGTFDEEPAVRLTLGDVIPQFIEIYARPRNRSWKSTERVLDKFTALHAMPIEEIKRADVVGVLDKLADAGMGIGATAAAGVHELGENDRIPRAMGHYVPSYDPTCARKESAPNSFAQYLARARFETVGSGSANKLVNATAAALLAASELAGGTLSQISRKSPHRRVVETLGDSDARANYLALQEIVLTNQGDITSASWEADAMTHIEAVVRQLSGVAALDGDVVTFLAAPPAQAIAAGEAAIVARSDNLFAYPPDAPRVRIRLGSIHSVKGETHTATLVLDSFFHNHHLSELKPWLLGTKSGGFSTNRRGRQVFEGPRILARLKLHYVAMTRPTHLLCLAVRKDAFGEGELDTLAGRGWRIIDCCAPAQL